MANTVWTSWPGGVGAPTTIALAGGKRRKSRKATRKVRKSTRKSRKGGRKSTRRS